MYDGNIKVYVKYIKKTMIKKYIQHVQDVKDIQFLYNLLIK